MSGVNGNSHRSSGLWVPTISFVTPGNLAVAYTTQLGEWYRDGNWLDMNFVVLTSSFAHSTASGAFFITGHPFTPKTKAGFSWCGNLFNFSGITKAGYTQFVPGVGSADGRITIQATGSAQNGAAIAPADMPTAGTVSLQGSIAFPLV